MLSCGHGSPAMSPHHAQGRRQCRPRGRRPRGGWCTGARARRRRARKVVRVLGRAGAALPGAMLPGRRGAPAGTRRRLAAAALADPGPETRARTPWRRPNIRRGSARCSTASTEKRIGGVRSCRTTFCRGTTSSSTPATLPTNMGGLTCVHKGLRVGRQGLT